MGLSCWMSQWDQRRSVCCAEVSSESWLKTLTWASLTVSQPCHLWTDLTLSVCLFICLSACLSISVTCHGGSNSTTPEFTCQPLYLASAVSLYRPAVPVTLEAEAGGSQVQRPPGCQSKFKASTGTCQDPVSKLKGKEGWGWKPMVELSSMCTALNLIFSITRMKELTNANELIKHHHQSCAPVV